MRHLIGFVLALAMSAALFFGAGLGVWKFASLHPASTTAAVHALTSKAVYVPIAALLGTAVLLGILLTAPRVSPLGPGLPGLVLLGWSALILLHWRRALSFVPMSGSHYAAGFTTMLTSGMLAMLGAAMIIPLFVPSRWRSTHVELDEYGSEDMYVPTFSGMAP